MKKYSETIVLKVGWNTFVEVIEINGDMQIPGPGTAETWT